MDQFWLLMIFSSFILSFSTVHSSENRIVGGRNTTIQQFPHQAAILYSKAWICGGTIIGTKWIITAAHCTYSHNDVSELTVRVGSASAKTGGLVYQVSRIFQHQEYDPYTDDYDYCLLELAKPLIFGATIFPAQLPFQDEIIPVGLKVSVTGWGRLSDNGPMATTLQVVEVPIVSQYRCKIIFRELTDRMVCAGFYRGGRDACAGDSGGPMVYGNKLIGIISWGRGCALPRLYGVYARVPNQRDWIRKITNI